MPKKGNKGKFPLDLSGAIGKLLPSQVALRIKLVITPAFSVRFVRFLPHVRPLARLVYNPGSGASEAKPFRERRGAESTASL